MNEPGKPDEDAFDQPAEYASSPCYMAEVDPAYNGFLDSAAVIELLNVLLEGERAGARGINELCVPLAQADEQTALQAIGRDEGRFCSMLYRHIERLGGTPSTACGAFFERLDETPGYTARLALLNRGQGWVVRKLDEALPRIVDASLRADLKDMRDVHVSNIERADALLNAARPA